MLAPACACQHARYAPVISLACEWYSQTMVEGSEGPGPARSGTHQVYVKLPPGTTASPGWAAVEGRLIGNLLVQVEMPPGTMASPG